MHFGRGEMSMGSEAAAADASGWARAMAAPMMRRSKEKTRIVLLRQEKQKTEEWSTSIESPRRIADILTRLSLRTLSLLKMR